MKKFRATITRTRVDEQLVEIDAHTIVGAAEKLQRFAERGERPRGLQIVTSYDQDATATEDAEVTGLREVP